jgi:hypothetical protein
MLTAAHIAVLLNWRTELQLVHKHLCLCLFVRSLHEDSHHKSLNMSTPFKLQHTVQYLSTKCSPVSDKIIVVS